MENNFSSLDDFLTFAHARPAGEHRASSDTFWWSASSFNPLLEGRATTLARGDVYADRDRLRAHFFLSNFDLLPLNCSSLLVFHDCYHFSVTPNRPFVCSGLSQVPIITPLDMQIMLEKISALRATGKRSPGRSCVGGGGSVACAPRREKGCKLLIIGQGNQIKGNWSQQGATTASLSVIVRIHWIYKSQRRAADLWKLFLQLLQGLFKKIVYQISVKNYQ